MAISTPYGFDDSGQVAETVTVEATHLMDWPRFLLSVTLFIAVLSVLNRR